MKVTFDESEKDKISAFENLPETIEEMRRLHRDAEDERNRISKDNERLLESVRKLEALFDNNWSELEKEWVKQIDSFASHRIYEHFSSELNNAQSLLREVCEKENKICRKIDRAYEAINNSAINHSDIDFIGICTCASLISIVFNIILLVVWGYHGFSWG